MFIQLSIILAILPQLFNCQTLFELYRAMISDQSAHSNFPPIHIEIFGESLCPDTTKFMRNQLMPVWNIFHNSNILNVSYHPFGLAGCKMNSDSNFNCRCQHGPEECQMNQLQSCVISALEIPQLYLPIINCIQGMRQVTAAVQNCIVQSRPRPDLDENFMIKCALSQLGTKLMQKHGQRQMDVARDLNWVPWILINGKRSTQSEISLKSVICAFSEPAKYEYCKTPDFFVDN